MLLKNVEEPDEIQVPIISHARALQASSLSSIKYSVLRKNTRQRYKTCQFMHICIGALSRVRSCAREMVRVLDMKHIYR
jgi:hypothetical protein